MLPEILSEDEQKAIKAFKYRLLDKYPKEIKDLRLFGSKARGDSHPESDIDLLIIVERRTEEIDDFIIELVCDVLNEFGVYLETVTYEKNSFESDLRMQYPFLLNVDRESIAI